MVAQYNLGDLAPDQWEVTYVNHMLRGTVWSEPAEWPTVFSSLLGSVIAPRGTRLEGFGGHWHFEIEPQRGRLHVVLQHAYVGDQEKKEALVMKLTARGPVEKDKDSGLTIDDGLNLGHEVIVTSFEALTSQRAHDYWNRENHDANG